MKRSSDYTIRELNMFLFVLFEGVIPATLIMLWLVRVPSADLRDTVIVRSIGKFVYAYVLVGISALWLFLSGHYKKVVFRIDSNGIAFSKKGYFYEYDWEEYICNIN